MKIKRSELTQSQIQTICNTITFDDCCSSVCPLYEVRGVCMNGKSGPSPEFQQAEIEVAE